MYIIWKNKGETPLEAMKRLIPHEKKKTYAGRLDPMADGLLLILIDEECNSAKEYLNLPKIYKYSVLFGVETDTLDPLGKILSVNVSLIDEKKLNLPFGSKEYKYPMYSSKTVNGKPLWSYARESRVVEIPSYSVKIKKHKLISKGNITGREFSKNQIDVINTINGDFRQKEIIDCWKGFSTKYGSDNFTFLTFEIEMSGGGYVRSVAEDLGNQTNSSTLAFNIQRIGIGDFNEVTLQ